MRIKFSFLFLILLLAACTPGDLEPGSDGIPITRETAATVTPTDQSIRVSPTATPTPPGTLPATNEVPTPWDVPSVTPPGTFETADTHPTPTPAPPFPGFRYETAEGIWQVNGDWQPQLLVNRPNVVLSEDGNQALYIEEGDIWLLDIASDETHNITENSGRMHCCVQWWPARPDTIIFGSWLDGEVEQNLGFLSAVQADGSGYTVFDPELGALPAPSPDGSQIAYGQGDSAWIYDWDTAVSTQLNLVDFGLENVRGIDGPSWSPDGTRLAWTVSITDPDWRIAVAEFDLNTGTAQLFHPYENLGRDGWFPGPAWHPDGDWLAFVAEEADLDRYGVWVVSTLSGEEQFIGRGQNPIWSPDGHWLYYTGFDTINGQDTRPWLVEFGSWYHVNVWIPENGRLLEWVAP